MRPAVLSPILYAGGGGNPLYQDLVSRTRAALATNPKNRLLAVVWMQGEADLASGSQQHNGLFTAMVQQFRTDLSSLAAQCVSGNAATVPWICGDTTYYWKNLGTDKYEAVYGGYKGKEAQNIFFVPFLTDENGQNTPTNAPAEDPDIVAVGYYGAAFRTQGCLSPHSVTAISAHGHAGASFLTVWPQPFCSMRDARLKLWADRPCHRMKSHPLTRHQHRQRTGNQ